MPQLDHRYLFVLNHNPDKATYAAPRACGVMSITGRRMQCLGQDPLLPFMQGIATSELLDQLGSAAAVDEQQ
jgi:hypothetical protein